MALTKCRECGQEISTDARVCPHCGKRITSAMAMGCAIFFLVLFAALVAYVVSEKSGGQRKRGPQLQKQSESEQTPSEAHKQEPQEDNRASGRVNKSNQPMYGQAATTGIIKIRQTDLPQSTHSRTRAASRWLRAVNHLRPGTRVYLGYSPDNRVYDHTIISGDGETFIIRHKSGSIEVKSIRMYQDWPLYVRAKDVGR